MQNLERLKGMLLGLGAGALALLWGAPALAGEGPQSVVQPAIYWGGDGVQVERAGYLGRYRNYGYHRGHGHHARRHAYRGHHYKRHHYKKPHYKKHYRRRHYDDYGYGYRQHRRGHRGHGDFCREDHDHHGHRYRRH